MPTEIVEKMMGGRIKRFLEIVWLNKSLLETRFDGRAINRES